MAWKNENKIKKKKFSLLVSTIVRKIKKKKKRKEEERCQRLIILREISLRFHEACVRADSRNQEELEEEEVIQW